MGSMAMLDSSFVPTSVHCAIPFSVCQVRDDPVMKDLAEDESEEEGGEDAGINHDLARNFRALMAGRSIGALRADMKHAGYPIGTSAIQLALSGRGNTLGVTQKFADYFGVSVADLIGSRLAGSDAQRSHTPHTAIADIRAALAVFCSGLAPAQMLALGGFLHVLLRNKQALQAIDLDQIWPPTSRPPSSAAKAGSYKKDFPDFLLMPDHVDLNFVNNQQGISTDGETRSSKPPGKGKG